MVLLIVSARSTSHSSLHPEGQNILLNYCICSICSMTYAVYMLHCWRSLWHCHIYTANVQRTIKPWNLTFSLQEPVKTVEETVARKGGEVPRNSEQKIITTAADLTAILPPPLPPIPPRQTSRSPPLPPRLPSFTEYFSMQSGGGGAFGTKAWGRTEGEGVRNQGNRQTDNTK